MHDPPTDADVTFADAAAPAFVPLISDFYPMGAALTEQGKAVLMRLRHYLETEVKPIVNDRWAPDPALRELGRALTGKAAFV